MTKEASYDHLQLVDLRVDLPDLRRDFNTICRKALEIWGNDDDLEPTWTEAIRYGVDAAKPYARKKPLHRNRVYMTTECIFPALVLVDLDESVLSHLKSVVAMADYGFERCWYREDSAALWVFEDRQLTFNCFLPTTTFGQLLTAFHQDNLVSRKHLRDSWYTQPYRDGLRRKTLSENADAQPPHDN